MSATPSNQPPATPKPLPQHHYTCSYLNSLLIATINTAANANSRIPSEEEREIGNNSETRGRKDKKEVLKLGPKFAPASNTLVKWEALSPSQIIKLLQICLRTT